MGIQPDPQLVVVSRKLFRELEAQPGVDGVALVGALARNLYAAPRATGDVDLAIALQDGEAYRAILKALETQGFALKGETQEPGSEYPSLAQLDGPVQLDLLIAHTEFEESAIRGSHVFGSGADKLAAVTPGDLIVYKTLRFSAQDRADIEEVVKAAGADVDWARAERYAKEFDVEDRVEWARSLGRQ